MEELNFTGNALKGSRPLLSFDAGFDQTPAMKLIKEMLLHIFGVPKGARKSKPFVDHVLSFTLADGKIWFRNYQVRPPPSVRLQATLTPVDIRSGGDKEGRRRGGGEAQVEEAVVRDRAVARRDWAALRDDAHHHPRGVVWRAGDLREQGVRVAERGQDGAEEPAGAEVQCADGRAAAAGGEEARAGTGGGEGEGRAGRVCFVCVIVLYKSN